MTYLRASLRGIPAQVELGDTLRNTRIESAWTPSTLPFYAKHGKLFPVREAPSEQTPTWQPRAPPPAPIADVTLQLDLLS